MWVALSLSIVVGVLDGFGLAMFIPLLQLVSGNEEIDPDSLGGLSFLLEGMTTVGLPLSLASVLLIILVFFSFKGILGFWRTYYLVLIKLYFTRVVRFKNIDGLARFSYVSFVQSNAGAIQNTMSAEMGRLSNAFGSYSATLQSAVMVLVYVSLALITNPRFTILVVIGAILSNLLYRQVYVITKKNSLAISKGGHLFHGLMIQMVSFFKYFKSTGYAKIYSKKLKSAVLTIEKSYRTIGYYDALLKATREPMIIAVVAAVILIQVTFLSAELNGIILSLLFFYRSLSYIMALQNSWNAFLNTSGAIENMKEFLHELKSGQEYWGDIVVEHLDQSIELKNISFAYGSKAVLQNISLTIPKNKTLAFVGESGSGKTTLMSIITGLLQPATGSISIDGVDYKEIKLDALQRKIGYITQEPIIYTDTIFNNISQWAEKTPDSLERFWYAAEQASVADFIASLEHKEESELGNNGIQISGGQKQRIAIARELFKDIDILLMDEATSALDSKTEKEIQENIERLQGQYTILVIAHRISTVQKADEIILLSDGTLKARGPFDELIENSEQFRSMAKLQVL
ncbi:MAG TPA: ABC transporter ATP-binding protein [Flavobacteriales bacterium]|jgi:ABC-type multidrug transport system fused ATPase/permease subunit|nr:ABC transporter ATP-binding protein [Flavobacteriales bacterium]